MKKLYKKQNANFGRPIP